MFDVITIGDATLDTFLVIDEATLSCDVNKENCKLCLNYADKIPITATGQSVGGNAANVAVGVGRLGFKTAIVTELGDDISGLIIKHELERAKIDTRFIKLLPGKPTRYSVVLNFQGERTVLAYHAKRQYTLPALPATRWLYYTSLGVSFERIQPKIIQYLKKHPDTKLALNPGSYQTHAGLKTIKEILYFVDVLFVNREEAERLVGKQKTVTLALTALHKKGVGLVALTDGERGSCASNGEEMYSMPIYPIKPLAKTGAGDAYASGWLAALLSGKSLSQAMQWGTANAGGVVQHWGAQTGLLNQSKLKKLVTTYAKIKPTLFNS